MPVCRWLMTEAKKRNPNIKLYGLPWAFPAWVGNGTGNPFAYPDLTAGYITKWVQGADTVYGLNIDYVVCSSNLFSVYMTIRNYMFQDLSNKKSCSTPYI